jgi:hypothetical protein
LKQNQNSALQATRETMKYKRKYNKREQKKEQNGFLTHSKMSLLGDQLDTSIHSRTR